MIASLRWTDAFAFVGGLIFLFCLIFAAGVAAFMIWLIKNNQ